LADVPESTASNDFATVLTQVRRGEPVFGGRLLIVRTGPVAVANAEGAALAFDEAGTAILLVSVESIVPEAPAEIADELEKLAHLSEPEVSEEAVEVRPPGTLSDVHAEFFSREEAGPVQLNNDQAVIIVTRKPPSSHRWKALILELGRSLSGVYLLTKEGVERLTIPPDLQPSRLTSLLTRGFAPMKAWSAISWLGFGGLLLGLGLVALASLKAFRGEPESANQSVLASIPRSVAAGVRPDATYTSWIGQRRLVETSRGNLGLVYPGSEGFHLVFDHRDQGLTWGEPVFIPSPAPSAYAVAIDSADRLHIALTHGTRVSYLFLRRTTAGWRNSPQLELDSGDKASIVDAAWDRTSRLIHVVWVKRSGRSERPYWAGISFDGGSPRVVASRPLARGGTQVTVLANVAVDRDGQVLVTYRRGDSVTGWFSRLGSVTGKRAIRWGREERLEIAAIVGASSLAFDTDRSAHLVLRDSTNHDLIYFTKRAGRPWTRGERVVDAKSVEEIDFPTLTLDRFSDVVYLFFQNRNQVAATVRSPRGGWERPFVVASRSTGGDGVAFPTSPALVNGIPMVAWTTAGASPTIEVARVLAP
jgi:hypothetical protein